ncbi:MAG: hypothetical protein LiPW39_302 [Parcubacteria group bacterium LiPW_39]|nr:MAG: hypothetical protein LiPW39_302 [Parcubacteria group bacterium LiPW_39]
MSKELIRERVTEAAGKAIAQIRQEAEVELIPLKAKLQKHAFQRRKLKLLQKATEVEKLINDCRLAEEWLAKGNLKRAIQLFEKLAGNSRERLQTISLENLRKKLTEYEYA